MPPAFPPEPKPEGLSLRETALALARETGRAHYVVMVPETKYEYTPRIPYVVSDESADAYERREGERVDP